jgi:DNA-binding NarL/FixJ family response regulator
VLSRQRRAGTLRQRLWGIASDSSQQAITLITTGHGNQKIAASLFLSHRTVENHVSSILAKLGETTRAAAAPQRLGIVPQTE